MITGQVLWQKLKALVDIDTHILSLKQEIVGAKDALVQINLSIKKSEKSLEDKKNKYLDAQKNVDSLELEAQAFQTEEERTRKQLNDVKNQREYKSLEKEIDHISKQRRELDDRLLRGWHIVEQFKREYEQNKDLCAQKVSQYSEDILKCENSIKEIEERLLKVTQERDVVVQQVPQEWRDRYERMKGSVPDPIVPVISECCSACYYSVLHQDMVKLKRSGVLLCRSCYRFLYYDENEQKDLKKATF